MRPTPSQRSTRATAIHRHSLEAVRTVRDFFTARREGRAALAARRDRVGRTAEPSMLQTRIAPSAGLGSAHLVARSAPAHAHVAPTPRAVERRPLVAHIRTEKAVPAVAVAILLAATALSSAPSLGQTGPVGGPSGDGPGPRIAAGGLSGGVAGVVRGPQGAVDVRETGSFKEVDEEAYGGPDDRSSDAQGEGRVTPGSESSTSRSGNVLDDGTILKPVAVDTTVADGKGLMRTYEVRPGDTLTGIARKHGVSMMTVWWANNLSHKDDLHVGQKLTIPPVSGVVVTVGATDTLEALAAKYQVDASAIVEANALDDPNLVIGQTLTVPGGLGESIATPTPAPVRPKSNGGGGGSSGGGSSKPPVRYSGGAFAWPVAGGYISQYYRYGHYGIDIAADRGTTVKAAASGVVIFAGWKSNGGGYQVWISHGSNLYTTYNHMSGVSVGKGQSVGRGRQVGRVGATGYATGPHLHFEVWKGAIWNGGSRVNPLAYL